ncbi:hypothetical protein ACQPZZ_32240 [Microbispora sp. CA-135349]|uniref:hypothetical protein n=1 Tax=Microbispora sp. CA-135349 TaxID=3239953 RepID=UPI003D925E78
MSDALLRDPYPVYAKARETPGLTFLPEMNAWLVARDADVREVLRSPEVFSSANALRGDFVAEPSVLAELGKGVGGAPVVVTSDGAAHQRYQVPLVRGLSPARVASVVPFIRERAESLVDAFASPVELVGAYARRLPGEVIGHLLGLDPEHVPMAVEVGYRSAPRCCTFGHGVHSCPGAQLAREQVLITLEILTRRLPGLRLAADRPVVMAPTLIHRGPEELWLTW